MFAAIATTINHAVSLFLKEVALLLMASPHATMQSDAAISSPKERLLFLLHANLNLIFFQLKGL